MKKLTAVITALFAVVAVGSTTAFAGQFGPPEPTAKDGHLALGVGYFYSESKLSTSASGFSEIVAKQNQAYLQASYGFLKSFEGYARVGGANIKLNDAFAFNAPQDFSDSFKPFGTVGVKGVFNLTSWLGIGPFVQGSIFSDYSDQKTGTVTLFGLGLPVSMDIRVKRPWEVDVGLALQAKISKAILYAGPFLYWTGADVDETAKVSFSGMTFSGSQSATYSEKNNVGGFVGVSLPLVNSLSLNLEGQFKTRTSVGAALNYAF